MVIPDISVDLSKVSLIFGLTRVEKEIKLDSVKD